MLSKKYYNMIANTIKNSRDKQEIVINLSYKFQKDNYNFDKSRFYNACLGE